MGNFIFNVLFTAKEGSELFASPTRNAKEAEDEWFYEDLQDLLELTPPKDVLFIIGDWNAKVGIKKHLE